MQLLFLSKTSKVAVHIPPQTLRILAPPHFMRTHSTFTFESYTFNKELGELSLSYSLDEDIFVEKVLFPTEGIDWENVSEDLLQRAFFYLHLIGGIGYWKTTLAPTMKIKSGNLSKEESTFWNTLYREGLGEFFFKNNIDFRNLISFPHTTESAPQGIPLSLKKGSLLPIGGGKDSLVSAEILLQNKRDFTAFSVHAHGPIQPCIDKIGKPWLLIQRKMDPLLFAWNDSGEVWNGHVPITAYISFVLVVCCLLYGYSDIVFSLEQSANEGMVPYLGMMVNHQYSKSYEFECLLSNYIHSHISPSINYYSLLRPWSELKITKEFTSFQGYKDGVRISTPERDYMPIFSSCNRNYKIHKQGTSTLWCGACEKCAFMYLMLGAYLPKNDLLGLFQRDLANDPLQLKTFKELLGLEGHKPFECVGTKEESILACYKMWETGSYKGSLLMNIFESEILAELENPIELEEEVMKYHQSLTIPKEVEKLLYML